MKRLTYISRFSAALSDADIHAISAVSVRNNQEQGITGTLLCVSDCFFQVIEGGESAIDTLYEKILADPRHDHIICLLAEHDSTERRFPGWAMETINLNATTEPLIRAIGTMMTTLLQSHSVLEKYTQTTILTMLQQGINPLTVAPQHVERLVIFSDIVAFTPLTERLSFADLDHLINTYVDICIRHIAAHGGTVTKLIGDSVMAYFSAEQTDDALRASVAILAALARLRETAAPASPLRLLHSGIGLAGGMVREGNIGSAVKMDYTVLGDAVNMASRLQGLTRNLPRLLLFPASVKRSARAFTDFVGFGKMAVKGKAELIDLYSLNDPATLNPGMDGIRQGIAEYQA